MTERTDLLTKADKRAAAKAAKARAVRAAKRKRVLSIAGAAIAVVAVLTALVILVVRNGGSADPLASASGQATPTAAAPTEAPFPPVPAGADPALSKKPEVKGAGGTLTSLVKNTLIEGTGPATASGQSITVNYVGVTYADGKEFDASWNSKKAFTFHLGGGEVIKGWDQGLAGIKVGSRVQLDIPPALAYGDNPTGGQPAGALRFVVDVLAAQ